MTFLIEEENNIDSGGPGKFHKGDVGDE